MIFFWLCLVALGIVVGYLNGVASVPQRAKTEVIKTDILKFEAKIF